MSVRLSTLIAHLQDLASDLDGVDPVVVGLVQPSYPMEAPLLGLAWAHTVATDGRVFLQLGGNAAYATNEFDETIGFDYDMDDV